MPINYFPSVDIIKIIIEYLINIGVDIEVIVNSKVLHQIKFKKKREIISQLSYNDNNNTFNKKTVKSLKLQNDENIDETIQKIKEKIISIKNEIKLEESIQSGAERKLKQISLIEINVKYEDENVSNMEIETKIKMNESTPKDDIIQNILKKFKIGGDSKNYILYYTSETNDLIELEDSESPLKTITNITNTKFILKYINYNNEKEPDNSNSEKLKRIEYEIYDTEKNYIEKLIQLKIFFIEPIRQYQIFQEKFIKIIFDNILDIFEYHKPMHRITRYSILFKRLASHINNPFHKVNTLLSNINEEMKKINITVGEVENKKKLLNIEETLDWNSVFFKFNIACDNRILINSQEFNLIDKYAHINKVNVYAFNDMLLVVRMKKNTPVLCIPPLTIKNIIQINQNQNNVYLLQAESYYHKNEWLKKINSIKRAFCLALYKSKNQSSVIIKNRSRLNSFSESLFNNDLISNNSKRFFSSIFEKKVMRRRSFTSVVNYVLNQQSFLKQHSLKRSETFYKTFDLSKNESDTNSII
ncbi:hypothetical protein LY90DRAFT_623840 [Neocallimastix californiae]|uniref:DH domain-containing protein n=1 Tax=Neocallimastix californiae TaxID=1754190 RepID=A0A1Y2BV47_9FUNG|nr:hypothetical protein LY90DRAFT_623840 [Neocallimastix californiae]|eukprot:ORY38507.1 hypothetical protein LY90DRAFT_623840 [Neocallimastix californiae]